MEEWRPVVGYEGYYEVSNHGVVRNIRARQATQVGKMLKGRMDHGGYPRVGLWRNGTSRDFGIHALVCRAFLGPMPEGLQVNHRDGVKTNNRLENLEYVTSKENHAHATRMGMRATGDRHGSRTHPEKRPRGAKHPGAKLTEPAVAQMRYLAAAGWPNVRLAKIFGMSEVAVGRAVRGITWKHVGGIPT